MYFYILMYFFASFFTANFHGYYVRVFSVIILGVLAALLLGLRAPSVGIDTEAYYWIYYLVNNDPDHFYIQDGVDFLYVALNRIVGAAGLGAEWVLFLCAVVTIFLMLSTVLKFSPSIALSFSLFLGLGYFFSLHNTMRQGVALMILFYSVRFIDRGAVLKFSACVLLAMGFHLSAMVFFPVYFVARLRIPRFYIVCAWFGSLVLALSKSLSLALVKFAIVVFPEKYQSYVYDSRVEDMGGQGMGIRLLVYQALFILMLAAYSKALRNDGLGRERVVLVISMVGLILVNCFFHVGVVSRVVNYFSIFIALGVPVSIYMLFFGRSRIIACGAIWLVLMMFFLRNIASDPHGVFPYSSVIG